MVRLRGSHYQGKRPFASTNRLVVVEPITTILMKVASGLEPRLEGGLLQSHLSAALVTRCATS